MKKLICAFISIFLFFALVPQNLFAEEAANYDDINFPQWAKDLRRTEIITFGSLPFVTLWTTVGYSLYEYGEFRNPLDKSTDDFTEEDMKKIIGISAVTCVGLGLTDWVITLIVRSRKEARIRKLRDSLPFTVTGEEEMRKLRPKIEEESDEDAERKIKEYKNIEEHSEKFIEELENPLF